jgi:hypothetical protein
MGSTTSVRLTPSASGGHCSASAVPINKTRMAHAASGEARLNDGCKNAAGRPASPPMVEERGR